MINGNTRIISPKIYPDELFSESEILGILLYLWYQNDKHRVVALDVAIDNIIPIIQSRNFAIFIVDDVPIGYVNWIYLSEDQQQHYLNNQLSYVEAVKAYSVDGDHKDIWLMTWFNCQKNHRMHRLSEKYIFKGRKVCFVYHKSTGNTKKIISRIVN
ncbi:toxin-activating lysine-acyltransferase [Zophobihabitans entericus]|uniref:RTX toxin-activating lysine-acyltransferase n=1 Tax=Zophobihabitans entericus TaxID=1635327 RepID=A0A6G9IEJ6_9GAMM|nr:toxin-activating lysine-acyltransferase [Zophobihabitans entericus]QIQ22010.1 toxin-activating lysine-acyltransferase [Zophobihabitans entericus]